MTAKEKSDYWYNIRELNEFKIGIHVLLNSEEQTSACQQWLLQRSRQMATNDSGNDPRNASSSKQWWHKYGHSRRGLEKFSADTAKQTVASHTLAVNKVLQVQSKQKYLLFSKDDPAEELASVYREYTAWSVDLALAAAASDRDAVLTGFDDGKRKTREFFLLKQLYKAAGPGQGQHHNYCRLKHEPPFMKPKGVFKPPAHNS